MSAPRALLLSGVGRYSDPWHPFAATSDHLAQLLRDEGFDVIIAGDVDAALEWLRSPWSWPDLLAVNVGLPRDGGSSPGTAAAVDGLQTWLEGDRPLLGFHVSSTSFEDSPAWEPGLGGRWVRDTTMHPEYGPAQILVDGSSSLAGDLSDFELVDERYSWLRTDPAITVHARHEHEDQLHPLVWTHERPGGGRTFYDALGHDTASFESAEHRELLRRGIGWLSRGAQ